MCKNRIEAEYIIRVFRQDQNLKIYKNQKVFFYFRSAHQKEIEAEITVCNTIMTSSKPDGEDENAKMLQRTTCPTSEQNEDLVFKVYPERWWLLLTVVLLNLANYSHWVAFPSVAKNAAKYYDQVFHLSDFNGLRYTKVNLDCIIINLFHCKNRFYI